MGVAEKGQSRAATLQWIIPAIILMVYLFVSLFSYSKVMQQQAEEGALERVGKQAVSVAGYYNGTINMLIDTAQATANQMIGDDDLLSKDNTKLIANLKDSLGLEDVLIVDRDGNGIDAEGSLHDADEERSRKYKDFFTADPQRTIGTTPDGKAVVVISAPIRTEKEWSGNVVFIFNPHMMSKLIDSTTYSYYFVFSNGLIGEEVGTPSDLLKTGENLYDVISGVTFETSSEFSFRKTIEASRSGIVCISYNGEKQYITYQPVGNYGSCVLVSVMESQIIKSAEYENKETTSLIIKIAVAIGIFVALVLSTYIANKVGYARQNKELQNKAETDLLTDLLNKVSTQKKIQEYLDGEGRDKVSMMCVLDVDNFKKINDTMGHAFGDEVLSSLGKRIRSEFRVTDIVGRIGGDEFVIFLKDLKDDAIIEREAKRIENFFKDFQVGSYTKYSPTASIGAAIYPRDAHDYESLYKAGDAALYKAKKRGKNQLAFYKDADDIDE